MIYSKLELIRAHQDIRNPYYNHSYDRYIKKAHCSGCGRTIGEQYRYPDFDKDFSFGNEKDGYSHCPYCGHKFIKESEGK